MGYVKKIKMRPGCMPSKFDCQHKTSLPSTSVSESVSNKRKKLQGGKNKRMKKSTSDKSGALCIYYYYTTVLII